MRKTRKHPSGVSSSYNRGTGNFSSASLQHHALRAIRQPSRGLTSLIVIKYLSSCRTKLHFGKRNASIYDVCFYLTVSRRSRRSRQLPRNRRGGSKYTRLKSIIGSASSYYCPIRNIEAQHTIFQFKIRTNSNIICIR